jgi:filamentous hemagglutinin
MNTPLKRALVNVLVTLLVLEPFSFAAAGGIVVAPGAPASKQATLDSAPNGVPIVDIVKPNASGLSHNQFDQFNVGAKGVIINNSNRPGVSQLGGTISGNANFGGGPEARLILNEVTGSSRSSIEGYTEIFGTAAQYILANPNGISVNGGGFINTPKATLTTGVPRLDAAGGLQSLEVRRGDILIDGQGINASNLDAFDIVTRATRINAAIYAKQLGIKTGYGDYAPGTGTFAPAAPDGSTPPTVSIDSTALGGMYADRITMIGNERGVGVSLAGTVRATDSLTLSAEGKIQIVGAVSADKDAAVTSGSDSIEISGKLGAGGAANVQAAQELRLASAAGGDAPLLYGNTVAVAAGTLTNADGKMLAASSLSATATRDMTNAGTLYAGTDAALNAGGVLNNSGQLEAKGALTATGQGGVQNSGSMQSGTDLTANSGSGLTNTGSITAQGKLSASTTGTLNNSGTMQSGGDLAAQSGADLANTGTLSAQGGLTTDIAGVLDNSGTLYAAKTGTIGAGSLANRSSGKITALGDALFTLGSDASNAGTITAGGQTTLRSAGSLRNEATGQVLAQTALNLDSKADLENLGTVSSAGTSSYSAAGQLKNSGTLSSSGSAAFAAANLTNDATGQILFQGDGQLTVSGDFTNAGLVYSGGKGTYRVGGTLLNNRGQFLSQGDMLLEGLAGGTRMTKLQNDSGGIESLAGGLIIRAKTVANNNLDFSLEEGAIVGTTLEGGLHSYGNDAWGVPSIMSWATGHSTTAAFQWNSGRIYAAYASGIGLDASRNVFSLAELTAAVQKTEQELATTPDTAKQTAVNWVKANVITPQLPYAVMILAGQRGEITVYEAKTATDKATGMDKGGSLAASTSLAVEADQFSNNVSKVSTASGDITINAASFENAGQDLYERSTVNWGRGFTNNSKHKGVYSEGYGQEVVVTPVGYAYGTISAGGKVAITATHVSNGISEHTGVASSGSAAAIVAPVKPGSLPSSISSLTDLIGALPSSGLFSVNTTPGHHYLVETNPALTNMSTFYGSDYFLSRAGIDLDKSNMQLLGDAYYETKLVREQIFSLTGKRLLSSTATSDAEQMQQLMDSALSAKQSLNLTVGVALTQDQIANLTQDIVWLEKTVVDGHEVLVPKVYLASKSVETIAEGGSVIVGKEVAVTTTGDTSNSGVIQATNTLTLTADNVLNTGGTLKGQTVAVSATDSITNTSGTIFGGDVTLSAGKDITVDTAKTTFASSNTTSEAVGQRGAVAATGALTMTAGDSISITGADVSAGGAANLTAGNTVAIAAQELGNTTNVSSAHYRSSNTSEVNQASTLTTGGALAITAGQDALVTGSTVKAGGDAAITAGRNVTIASATDSQEFSRSIEGKSGGLFGGKSSESASGSSTTNVAAQVSSGGALTVQAGAAGSGDLVVSGSKATSGGAMSLKAADDVLVASAQEESSSSYSSSKKGTWSSKTLDTTANSTTTVRSKLTSGGDLGLASQDGNVTVKASTLESGGAVHIESQAGEVALLTATSSTYSQDKKSGSNVVWQSTSDKGALNETVEHTEITAKGDIQIIAAKGVTVQYRDTGNINDSITQLAKQPGLAWMDQLRNDPKVNWQAVSEAHQNWNYKSEGLTGAGAALLSLAVAVATSGWGAALTSTMGLAADGMAAAAVQGGFASLCSQAAVGLANNKGDVLATLQGLASDQGIRALASSMLTASLTSGAMDWAGLKPPTTANAEGAATDGAAAGQQAAAAAEKSWQTMAETAAISGGVQATVGTAIYGGNLGQNLLNGLRGAAVDELGADLATKIGTAYKDGKIDDAAHLIAHAALGGAMAAADGKDAASGALGAVVGEITADELSRVLKEKLQTGDITPKDVESWIGRGVDLSKLTAGLAAAVVGDDVNTAARTGGNAAKNNGLSTLLKFLYAFAVGKGNLFKGLEAIGKGDDPLSKAINEAAIKAVSLAAANYPEQTRNVLEMLSKAGGVLDATVTYLDEASGQYVSRTWSSIPETNRNEILGLVTIVSLDTKTVKEIAELKATATELKTAKGIAKAAHDADNAANAARLWKQLAGEEAGSLFTADGKLTKEALEQAKKIENINLGNPNIPAGYSKYTIPIERTPTGMGEVHFYGKQGPNGIEPWYGLDYKVKIFPQK